MARSSRNRGRVRGRYQRPAKQRWNRTIDTIVTPSSWTYEHNNADFTDLDIGPVAFTIAGPDDPRALAPLTVAELVPPLIRVVANTDTTVTSRDFSQGNVDTAISALKGMYPQFKRSYYGTYGRIELVHPASTILQLPLSFGLKMCIVSWPSPDGRGAVNTNALTGVSLWSHAFNSNFDVLWSRTITRFYGGWWDALVGGQTVLSGNRLINVPVMCRAKRKLQEQDGIYLLFQLGGVGQSEVFADMEDQTMTAFNYLKSRVALFS